jgi:hypothetical protein
MDPDPDWFSNTTFDVFNALSDWSEIDTGFSMDFPMQFLGGSCRLSRKKKTIRWHEDITRIS